MRLILKLGINNFMMNMVMRLVYFVNTKIVITENI